MALFANAQKIETTKTKKVTDVAQHIVKGLSRFAAINAAIKSLTALASVEEAAVKELMTDQFVASGMARKAKPDNFQGIEDLASASCQLKIKSSASVLTEDMAKILVKEKIPYTTKKIQDEAFLINPKYTHDMELLRKVEEALANVDLPEDFMLSQPEITCNVASNASIDAVFALQDEAKVRELLPLVTTLAIKPEIKGNFWKILDDITDETSAEKSDENTENA